MKPIFTVSANGKDITGLLQDRVTSLVITDDAGFKSDTATFVLDNREQKIGVPPKGATLAIRLGYEDGGAWITGEYTVDDISLSGRPDILTISAKAADMKNRLKAPKSRSWDVITIGDLAGAIAEDHEYQPKVSEPLASTVIPHIDQTEESDMHLLTRIAQAHGAIFKPANGYLIMAPRHQLKSFTGKTLVPIVVDIEDVIGRWNYNSVERGKYQSVIARWRDTVSNIDVDERVGTDDPAYRIRRSYADPDEARAAAQAKKDALDRGAATLSIPTIGLPAAKAEIPLTTTNFHPVVDSAEWVVNRAIHTLNGSGLTSRIEAEIKT